MTGPARRPPSEALVAMLEALDDGSWHEGLRIFRIGERAVPDGHASRVGAKIRLPGATMEQMISSGRREITRDALTATMWRGRLECDPPKLTKAHWLGKLPWRVRDPLAGTRSVLEAAEELDIPSNVLYGWINNGFVPTTLASNGNIRFSAADFAIVRKVREVWPGKGKIRWPVDPKSLWGEQVVAGGPALNCPHCGEPITVVVGRS